MTVPIEAVYDGDDLAPTLADSLAREFHAEPDGPYRFALPALGVVFELDRVRRERHELIGELLVRCALPGARTYAGVLSAADFNLSSARGRVDRSRLLASRSGVHDLDWQGLLEEFCQRVLQADRTGGPAVSLRDVDLPDADDHIEIDGLPLPRRHPAILFGDGGSGKSYLALWLATELTARGLRVGFCDWELDGASHRHRLQLLTGPVMPDITYIRCERALVHEADRIRRIVREYRLDYLILDSVAAASDAAPEAAEVAANYFRALRSIGEIGSLNVAHVTKSGDNADLRPFGSAFWHNLSRATWNIKTESESPTSGELAVCLWHRKSNLGARRSPVSFRLSFTDERTTIRRTDPASVPEFADALPLRERMVALLMSGPMSKATIARELQAKPEAIKKALYRDSLSAKRFLRAVNVPDTDEWISLRPRENA